VATTIIKETARPAASSSIGSSGPVGAVAAPQGGTSSGGDSTGPKVGLVVGLTVGLVGAVGAAAAVFVLLKKAGIIAASAASAWEARLVAQRPLAPCLPRLSPRRWCIGRLSTLPCSMPVDRCSIHRTAHSRLPEQDPLFIVCARHCKGCACKGCARHWHTKGIGAFHIAQHSNHMCAHHCSPAQPTQRRRGGMHMAAILA
jgi:hypothetical protein